MEVILPSHTSDFDLSSGRSSPHVISAPGTPKFLGEYYFSAPTSPSHLSQFYKDFDDFLAAGSGSGTVPKSSSPKNLIGDDFAFDVSEEWETASQLSAEELFDGGVIKPLSLKTQPAGIRLPKVEKNKIQGAFSPRGKNSKRNPAAEINRRGRSESTTVDASKSSSRRAAARSLSPIRDGEYQYWEDDKQQSDIAKSSSMIFSSKGSKKWRLKDFFLFRSASEGRADEKDHLKKYTAAYRQHSSFRSIDGPGQKKGPVSAHELHYTVNRAVSQELKKKTFLPYKQGILGRLAFNPAVHALANGFGFSRK